MGCLGVGFMGLWAFERAAGFRDWGLGFGGLGFRGIQKGHLDVSSCQSPSAWKPPAGRE